MVTFVLHWSKQGQGVHFALFAAPWSNRNKCPPSFCGYRVPFKIVKLSLCAVEAAKMKRLRERLAPFRFNGIHCGVVICIPVFTAHVPHVLGAKSAARRVRVNNSGIGEHKLEDLTHHPHFSSNLVGSKVASWVWAGSRWSHAQGNPAKALQVLTPPLPWVPGWGDPAWGTYLSLVA
ncbi:unnamed protein product [Tetraodon nigroviridis]|uniref:(spotted green pufferfish) hypothetical protein n=1 Tax=Tetraodon nigroviridis TaxID=99883 RepID=Q4RMI1_TETNG|nr:unnamed protein product [Tetraodon nigroviridis]